MDDQLNFDMLDVLAAAVGIVIAFMLLPQPSDRLTERIVVPISMLTIVTIKRLVIPTKAANPESDTVVRLLYLFMTIVGTICIGLTLLAKFADLEEFSNPEVIETLLASGITLLIVATYIDRRWLKIRE